MEFGDKKKLGHLTLMSNDHLLSGNLLLLSSQVYGNLLRPEWPIYKIVKLAPHETDATKNNKKDGSYLEISGDYHSLFSHKRHRRVPHEKK